MIDDELDLRLRDWFAAGPTALSTAALEQVVDRTRERPQVHRPRGTRIRPGAAVPQGLARPNRLVQALAVAAAIVIAIVGLRLVTLPDAAAPTPAPTTSVGSPPPAAVVQDASLLTQSGWSTLDPAPGMPEGRWELSLSDWAIVSMPSIDGDGIESYALWLRPLSIVGQELHVEAPTGGACVGQPARYGWSILPGDVLRLTGIDDGCVERRAALEGRDWTRSWIGTLESGLTYRADQAPVTVGLTVPAGIATLDGTGDYPWYTHVATELGTSRMLLTSVVEQVYIDPCDLNRSILPFDGDAAALADWLESHPPLEVSDRRTLTLDGRPAVRMRIHVDRSIATDCFAGVVGYWADPGIGSRDTTGSSRQGQLSTGDTTEEMTLVDVDGKVIAITAQAPDATFDDWLERVGPMIESADFD